MTRTFRTLCILALLLSAHIALALNYVSYPPSAEANGRAGVFASTDIDDPLALIVNPALLGFMADRNRVLITFYSPPTSMRDDVLANVTRRRFFSRAAAIGFDRDVMRRATGLHWPLSVGLGYHETIFQFEFNEPGRLGRYQDESRGISLAAALHYRYAQIGVGLSHRETSTTAWFHRSSLGNTTDAGLFVHAPLIWLWKGDSRSLSCALNLGYAISNVGPRTVYSDLPEAELPDRMANATFGFSAALNMPHPSLGPWKVFSFDIGYTGYQPLTELIWDASGYRVRYKSMRQTLTGIPKMLLGVGKEDAGWSNGLEVGVAEALYYRLGHAETVRGNSQWIDPPWVRVSGFGIRLSGLYKLVSLLPSVRGNATGDFVVRHFDLKYDQSGGKDVLRFRLQGSAIPRWNYHQLTLAWKY